MTSTVTIVGNLTKDPELRFTPTGRAHITMGVAVNRRWQNRQTNEWEEATSFVDVVAWSTQAENVAECLKRGDRVIVEGQLDQQRWENAEGDKKSRMEIYANEIGASVRFALVKIKKNDRPSLQTVPPDDNHVADVDANADADAPF
jgi:single-strand DNA-binding protein